MNITIRKATKADTDFIITAITEAEKSNSDMISYCTIFSISEAVFRELLVKILDEDIEGQELCISGFLVAEVDGEQAAAICGWVEMEDGIASNMIKSNLLTHFLDKETIFNAVPNLKLMGEIDIHRDENTLQLESTYTVGKYRGMGLYAALVNEHIRYRKENGANV